MAVWILLRTNMKFHEPDLSYVESDIVHGDPTTKSLCSYESALKMNE